MLGMKKDLNICSMKIILHGHLLSQYGLVAFCPHVKWENEVSRARHAFSTARIFDAFIIITITIMI